MKSFDVVVIGGGPGGYIAAITGLTFYARRRIGILPCMFKQCIRGAITIALFVTTSVPGAAQSRPVVTVADYERAEKFMNYNTNPLVSNGPVRANWLAGDRFWYRNQTATGFEFILVDPAKPSRAPAFDHGAVAAALSAAMKRTVTAAQLPFQQITFAADLQSFHFDTDLRRWTVGE